MSKVAECTCCGKLVLRSTLQVGSKEPVGACPRCGGKKWRLLVDHRCQYCGQECFSGMEDAGKMVGG